MDPVYAQRIINHLYEGINGFALSQKARTKLPYYYAGHDYGEATFESFYRMLSIVHPKQGEIFYDLGSGVGKKVFIASFCFPFSTSVGIELFEDLYHVSSGVLNRFITSVQSTLPKVQQQQTMQFIHADFNTHDFLDGDVIYISLHPAALDIELSNRLGNKLEHLKKGSRLITSNIPFFSPLYDVFKIDTYTYKDGEGTVFFHRKII